MPYRQLRGAIGAGLKAIIPSALLVRRLSAGHGRRILLTFDDGPDPEVTSAVLTRLEAHDARAVFFVVGRRAARVPHLLKLIQEKGHVIGNHSFAHNNDGDPWALDYFHDMRRCQDLVQEHTQARPSLFRPPRGHVSLKSLILPRLLGLRTVNWSLNVRDWKCRTREEALVAAEQLVREAAPGQIVLLHDDNPRVLDILDYVLPLLKSRGFDLRTGIDLL